MSEGGAQARKLLVAQVFGALLVVLLGHVIATQVFAHRAHYAVVLGEPLWAKGQQRLYAPWLIYSWVRTLGPHAEALGRGLLPLVPMTVMVALAWVVGLQRKKTPQAARTAHGSARWASEEELKARGMHIGPRERLAAAPKQAPVSATNSVVFARLSTGEHLYDCGKEHLLCFAPTRSGKGVGMVIPTLLTWEGSVVVTDIKGENYQRTAAYRRKFSHVLYFNPTDPNSVGYNPLAQIEHGPRAIMQVQQLVEILFEREKTDPFWDGGAKNLLNATILHVLMTSPHKSLRQVSRALSMLDALLEEMKAARYDHKDIASFITEIAQECSGAQEKIRQGWASGAQAVLGLFKDPILAEVTSRDDFSPSDLQHAEHPCSLYLVIPPGDLKRLAPLLRVLFTQLIDEMTRELDDPDEGSVHRVLMLLDEFPQLGRMEKLEASLAYAAGYGVKYFLICQGLQQLAQIYGEHHALVANCHTRLAYRCNDLKNAERLSKLLGTGTGFKHQEGRSGKGGMLAGMENRSRSEVEFARALMTPDELMTMPGDDALVLQAGHHPARVRKLTYYTEDVFIRRTRRIEPFPTSPCDDLPSPYSNKVARAREAWPVCTSTPTPTPEQAPTPAPAPEQAKQAPLNHAEPQPARIESQTSTPASEPAPTPAQEQRVPPVDF